MKIAVFAVFAFALFSMANAAEPNKIIGWTLVNDTTLPRLDQKLSEKGLESAHFCTYKADGAPESASKMMLVIPGNCLPWFGVAGFTKPQ